MSLRRLGVIVRHEPRISPAAIHSRSLILIVFPVINMAFLKPAFEPALAQQGYRGANGSEQVVPGQAVMTAFFLVSLITFAFFSEHALGDVGSTAGQSGDSLEIVLGKAAPRVRDGCRAVRRHHDRGRRALRSARPRRRGRAGPSGASRSRSASCCSE